MTCSHTSTPESICKTLPPGLVTGGQPSLEHLQELISGVMELYSDVIQFFNPEIELQPKVVPLHIQKLLQQKVKVIQGQYLSWKIRSGIIYTPAKLKCILASSNYNMLLEYENGLLIETK